jgi:uncharacterized RDD family membrane protein YckC
MNHQTNDNKNSQLTAEQLPPASIFRIIGAWVYDFLLLCSVWLLAGFVYIIPAQMLVKIDSSNIDNLSTTHFSGPVFLIYMLLITWLFFAWFWTHGGQTLGLRAWSLRVQTLDGYELGWRHSLIRFTAAAVPWLVALYFFDLFKHWTFIEPGHRYLSFLIGFSGLLWIKFDKQQLSLQDWFSGTRIVRLPKAKKQKKD